MCKTVKWKRRARHQPLRQQMHCNACIIPGLPMDQSRQPTAACTDMNIVGTWQKQHGQPYIRTRGGGSRGHSGRCHAHGGLAEAGFLGLAVGLSLAGAPVSLSLLKTAKEACLFAAAAGGGGLEVPDLSREAQGSCLPRSHCCVQAWLLKRGRLKCQRS